MRAALCAVRGSAHRMNRNEDHMNLIAAVDENWAIGNKGQLLVRIPADHRMFRQETLDKVVVYGRKTLETFPMAQPLDRRVNIVLSANPAYKVRNATVVHRRCLHYRWGEHLQADAALLRYRPYHEDRLRV